MKSVISKIIVTVILLLPGAVGADAFTYTYNLGGSGEDYFEDDEEPMPVKRLMKKS